MGRTVRAGRCECEIEYSPLPSQAKFHKSRSRFKGFSGPIGSGKSQALCHEAVKLAYINAGQTGLVGAPTYPMLRDTTLTALLEILEVNEVPFALHRSEGVLTFRDTGSRILLRSLEEYERLRGTNLAWFGLDELTYAHREAWSRLEGRLRDPLAKRLCGFAVWTPKGHDWVYERFIKSPPEGFEVTIARPMENRYVLDKIPDFYERLRHSYDEKFYRQEVLGEYLNATEGLVYGEFNRATHIRELELNPGLLLLWALDFNVDPMCSIVAQMDGDSVYVLDEIVLHRASTQDACEEFANRYGDHRKGIVIYGDASGNAHQTTGHTDFEIIRKSLVRLGIHGVQRRVPRSNPRMLDRVRAVNAKFRNAAGEIGLRISPRCRELVRDFEAVTFKEGSGVIDKGKDAKRTHLSDALGYLIWQEDQLKRVRPRAHGPLV